MEQAPDRNCRPWRAHVEAGLPCTAAHERTHAGAGGNCEEEGAAERSCYGLTTTSILPTPLRSGGRT